VAGAAVRITHKVDYGVRAMVALAAEDDRHPGRPVSREALAGRDGIPPAFLEDILRDLRKGGLAASRRGSDGGWSLARPAADISVADVIRALEGPLASVRGIRPHELADEGVDEALVALWVAVRAALRSVLDRVTVADLAAGRLPPEVRPWLDSPGAWGLPDAASS
jgi:Rrf2 family protein